MRAGGRRNDLSVAEVGTSVILGGRVVLLLKLRLQHIQVDLCVCVCDLVDHIFLELVIETYG